MKYDTVGFMEVNSPFIYVAIAFHFNLHENQFGVIFVVSVGVEILSKEISTAMCGSADAANVYYNHNAAGSLTSSETEDFASEHKSNLNHVLKNYFKHHEQSAEIKSNILDSGNICGEECISIPGASACLEDDSNCVFPEITFNDESLHSASDDDESMHERCSSPTADHSASSDGPSSDNYLCGLQMEADGVGVVLYPDYIDYCGAHYLDPVVTFYRDSVEVKSKAMCGNEGIFHIHLEIDDIVRIESQWSAQYKTVDVNICFISKATESDFVHNASGIQELRFPAIDSNWYKKQEAIESLDVRYKAVWDVLLDTATENCSALPAGKALKPPKSYCRNFQKPFDELIYPKGDPDAVSINKRDIDLLRPDTFVNDTIIDFYIKYLKTGLNVEEKIKFHFFNSFFFRKLADMDKDPSSAFDGKAAFLRVRKWTRKVNLLEKDFIFIPVNYNYHWSLIVICYFGEAASYRDVEGDKSMRVPCVLHMDSIKGSHAGLKDLMQSYLWEEWKERQNETCEDLYSKFRNLKFVSLELPQQQNSYDCGLFLLHYVELFLKEVPTDFNIHKLSPTSEFLQADWFPPGEASLKRVHMERLIDDLLDTQSEDSPEYGGSDMHCSSDGPKTTHDSVNGVELSEKSSPLRSFPGHSLCSEDRQVIEMTLLPASSLRSTQCAASTGLVLELFESGSASESLNNAPWEEFEGKRSLDEFRRPVSMIEEEVETGEHFAQTQIAEPAFTLLDGITTGADKFPYSHGEIRSEPGALNDAADSPQMISTSDSDVSEVDADEKIQSVEDVELDDDYDELKCFSSVIMECPMNRDSVNDMPLCAEALSINQTDLKNASDSVNDMPLDAEALSVINQTDLKNASDSRNVIDQTGLRNASDSGDVMLLGAESHGITNPTDLENVPLADQTNCVEFASVEKLDASEFTTEDSSEYVQGVEVVDGDSQSDEQLPPKRMRVTPPEIY